MNQVSGPMLPHSVYPLETTSMAFSCDHQSPAPRNSISLPVHVKALAGKFDPVTQVHFANSRDVAALSRRKKPDSGFLNPEFLIDIFMKGESKC